MIISIASGKGGTGKTTVATSFALAIGKMVQLLDCDVEEPNAYIFIKPVIQSKERVLISVPKIDREKCNLCGKCAEVCVFNALAVLKDSVLVYSELCHGCGACSYLCPQGAIKEIDKEIGYIESGQKGALEFVQGVMNVGEVMATPVIRELKRRINRDKTVIIDSPPGTTCPMIESVKDSDYCILVTESTPFGLNDLVLAVEVLNKLGIKFGVIINRSDISSNMVEEYCRKESIQILMKIPFNKDIAFAYSNGVPIVEALPAYQEKFMQLFNDIYE